MIPRRRTWIPEAAYTWSAERRWLWSRLPRKGGPSKGSRPLFTAPAAVRRRAARRRARRLRLSKRPNDPGRASSRRSTFGGRVRSARRVMTGCDHKSCGQTAIAAGSCCRSTVPGRTRGDHGRGGVAPRPDGRFSAPDFAVAGDGRCSYSGGHLVKHGLPKDHRTAPRGIPWSSLISERSAAQAQASSIARRHRHRPPEQEPGHPARVISENAGAFNRRVALRLSRKDRIGVMM